MSNIMLTPSTIPERPILSSAEDKFERGPFIERLASALVNSRTNRSTGVVVGITGPWGSGKSSILNLLKEHLTTVYPDALVVPFDPWLVSGRNDLIAEFFGELIGTINSDEKRFAKFKALGSSAAEYGAHLAPIGNLILPGIGSLISGSLKAAQTALSKKQSLATLRLRLVKELAAISAPIVILIDELDRIEDDEVRSVAQLVRSVADFPGISYVLAYDPDRVMQALGGSGDVNVSRERGRSYLEKIVQLQIPLPLTLDEEIIRSLTSDLSALKNELRLPDNFENIERYNDLMQLLAGDIVCTPRDVRRLIGSFHVLAGMLGGEVDWIDLLAYSALLAKAPATVAKMRRQPDDYLETPTSTRGVARYLQRERMTPEERLKELIPEAEATEGIKGLVSFLFPRLAEDSSDHPDAFHERRPMLTTLRLGLLPGSFSRDQIRSLVTSPVHEISAFMKRAYEDGNLAQLTDRLDEVYASLNGFNHVYFWMGVGDFARKQDCDWMTSYQPMHTLINDLSRILERAVDKKEDLKPDALAVFSNLRNSGEPTLTAFWIRHHIFCHGLFGSKPRVTNAWFLNMEQTEALARDMAQGWRSEHLSGKLIPCRWDLQPVFTMIDIGIWDDLCRKYLDEALIEDRALEGFTLMLYGASFSTDKETVAKMCNYEMFLKRVKQRLNGADAGELHETVRLALRKASDATW